MTNSQPENNWGLVYHEPGKSDVLLARRYSSQDVAIRIAMQIARQYVTQSPEPELAIHRSSQNVVSVSSRETGRTYFTVRPVRASAFLAGGHAPAPEDVNRHIQSLLDDDEWER